MNLKFTFIALMFITSIQLQAQDTFNKSKNNDLKKAFKILPINAAVGQFVLGYEHQISKRSSLEFYTFYDQATLEFHREQSDPYKFYDIGLSGGYKYYFTKKEDRLQGFYGRSSLKGSYIFSDKESINEIFYLGLEAYAGYQWVLNSSLKGFVIDLSGGLIAEKPITDIELRDNLNDISVDPRIIFSIGYSF